MALATGTVWQAHAAATAGNVNAGGFNPGNANFLTDLAATAANTAAPVVTSASYNFVAGDVGAWLYVKAGTSWTPGWYQIASVAANEATLNAAVGAAVQVSTTTGDYNTNTVAGCATVATPSSGTFGIDFSQQDAAVITDTDLACADGDAASPVVTSVNKPMSVRYIGNIMHITAGTGWTAGWYEIVSVSTTNATLDRAIGTDGSKTGGTFYVGGALNMQSTLDDDIMEALPAGSIFWWKKGTYTQGEGVAVAATTATKADPIWLRGFDTIRGDNPLVAENMPKYLGQIVLGAYMSIRNFWMVGTGSNPLLAGTASRILNCYLYAYDSSGVAISTTSGVRIVGCSISSGHTGFGCVSGAASSTSYALVYGCYIHNSHASGGVALLGTGIKIVNNIIHACDSGVQNSTVTANLLIANNTIIGRRASKLLTGINLTGSAADRSAVFNNIIVGFVTAFTVSSATSNDNMVMNNILYDCTNRSSNSTIDGTNITLDPGLPAEVEIAGTTATSSTTTLTDATKNFNTVIDQHTWLHVLSGTSATAGVYRILSHTATTITVDRSIGNSVAGNLTYFIPLNRDFSAGSAIKDLALPSTYLGTENDSYIDVGGPQLPPPSGGSSNGIIRSIV